MVIRRVAFPLPRGLIIGDNFFEQFLKNRFAIGAIGHYDDRNVFIGKIHIVMPPRIVMAFFKKSAAILAFEKSPTKRIRQLDVFVFIGSIIGYCWKLVFGIDCNL